MKPTELIFQPDGSVYHLHLLPEDVADCVLLVGDPGRVDRVARHFDSLDLRKEKREFVSATGWLNNRRITVLSTGIGTDNIDIVLNELDALVNLSPEGDRLPSQRRLKVLRLGTCGGLQPDLPPGALVLSAIGVGLDALGQYYVTSQEGTGHLLAAARQALAEAPGIAALAYAAFADPELIDLASRRFPDLVPGITWTAAGFYGPQGRSLGRVPLRLPGLPEQMATVQANGLRSLNLEMETAAILHLGRAMGHRCGALSVILANRPLGQFHPTPGDAVEQLIEKGLELAMAWFSGE